ncbi:hypothetical protein DYH55_20065 [Methylovirgula sp. 4M-Z18]|nr:hypothetical protein DYH55_20065 [Methylovirgula sp. 4M-Z18]
MTCPLCYEKIRGPALAGEIIGERVNGNACAPFVTRCAPLHGGIKLSARLFQHLFHIDLVLVDDLRWHITMRIDELQRLTCGNANHLGIEQLCEIDTYVKDSRFFRFGVHMGHQRCIGHSRFQPFQCVWCRTLQGWRMHILDMNQADGERCGIGN